MLKCVWLQHVSALKRSFRLSVPKQSSSDNIVLVGKKKKVPIEPKKESDKSQSSSLPKVSNCPTNQWPCRQRFCRNYPFHAVHLDTTFYKKSWQLQRPLTASPTCTTQRALWEKTAARRWAFGRSSGGASQSGLGREDMSSD